MYKISMDVDGIGVDLFYDEYDKAVAEFKECVIELLNRSDVTDNITIKINKTHSICELKNGEIKYVLKLLKVNEEGE